MPFDFKVAAYHVKTGWESPEGAWILGFVNRFTWQAELVQYVGHHLAYAVLKAAWFAQDRKIIVRAGNPWDHESLPTKLLSSVPWSNSVTIRFEDEGRVPQFNNADALAAWLDCASVHVETVRLYDGELEATLELRFTAE